jgi:membrane protease YdiL (CAAX protease family)
MSKRFKIYFIISWVITFCFLLLNVIYGFAQKWMITTVNYLYVLSLICLFIESNFLEEKTTNTEKLIELKNYDIWGLIFLIICITGILLFIGFKSSVIMVMAAFTFLISIIIIIKYRKLITKQLILNGLILAIICSIALYKYIPSLVVVFIALPCFFISSSIINDKFSVTKININKRNYNQTAKSFLMGCLFALPMAIANLSDALLSNGYKWINQFWQPLLALNMSILEETWVRLFVITLIFALVSSKTNKRFIPIITAILISSVIFGFTHSNYLDIQNCINITILYGLPIGVLFIKRDFETVIGYHFMINFIGAIAAFLINSNIH